MMDRTHAISVIFLHQQASQLAVMAHAFHLTQDQLVLGPVLANALKALGEFRQDLHFVRHTSSLA